MESPMVCADVMMLGRLRLTRVTQYIKALRGIVYRALIDPNAIAIWKVQQNRNHREKESDKSVSIFEVIQWNLLSFRLVL